MISAPERAGRPPGRVAKRAPAGRPRRLGRSIAVLVVLGLGGIGVAVTWPAADPPIVSDKVSPPDPVDPNAAAAPCAPEDLDIGLAADRTAVTPGVPVRFTVSVRNEGPVQCLVDAPRRSLAVTLYQGEVGEPTAERAWSSADCADPDEERLLLLGPGDVDVTSARWSDSRSVPGCEPGQPKPAAGEYSAQVTLADVDGASSDVVRLTYTVPEPTRSPSPSPSGSPSGSPSASPSPDPSDGPGAAPSTGASEKPRGESARAEHQSSNAALVADPTAAVQPARRPAP
ncbi:hypothetical protein [Promicromonospora soli]|uniref:Uncharacterized protein n=1 Tax=Promicromonospora soli TaxID=2035533 RepID=A0A919FMS0_9MICO|nr:hypothetical protein [Promicromonospora soli]GHH68791.1 hypothetical protein GCM10017772_12600 [Promicromonospora soli]